MSTPPAAPPSPRPRRITTPSWLDVRLVLGVLLVLASVLLGARVVSGAQRTYASVAARRDLAAGTVLTRDDVQVVQVRVPGHGRLYLSRTDDVVGRQLARAVSGGELVPAAAIRPQDPHTTVSLPLAAAAAPGLRKGQRIEVWVSTPHCSSVVLLPDVTVQAVHADSGASFGSGTGGQDVVLSVSPQLADRVVRALALEDATLRAGVLVGARQGVTLPALDTCTGTSGGR